MLLEGEDTWFPAGSVVGESVRQEEKQERQRPGEWRESRHCEKAMVRHPSDKEGKVFPRFGNREVTGDLKDSMFQ